jgi:hypothetical protein
VEAAKTRQESLSVSCSKSKHAPRRSSTIKSRRFPAADAAPPKTHAPLR